MKFVDLVIEAVMLLQFLEDGLPVVLVAVFTMIVAANAVACALVMFLPNEQTLLMENLIDLMYVFSCEKCAAQILTLCFTL